MNLTVDQIVRQVPVPFLYVDYNELIDRDTVMLSQHDSKNDYFGNPVALYEGLALVGYQEDEEIDGTRDDLILEGVCTPNQTGQFPHVKWLLRGNEKGIRYMSDIARLGW